ncbi:LysM peptidoglycan-binding domain-containing protein [Candidatus Saccharibacteria bacterium]|nr:LysM peptidoglycan-binding domain-containing protein [Candidatus Saccharibacteria bacterium]
MSKNTINTSEWIKKILPYILATGGILAVVIAGSIGKMNASSSISLDSMVTGTSEVSVDTMTELYTVADLSNTLGLASAGDVADNYVMTTTMYDSGQTTAGKLEKPSLTDVDASRGVVEHVLAEGESLDTVAAKYGVTTDQIRWSNGLKSTDVAVGTTLFVPSSSGIVYTVKSFDTVESIATKYGSSVEEITALNDLEVSGISEGMKILVKDGTLPETERPEYVPPVRTYTAWTYTYLGNTSERTNAVCNRAQGAGQCTTWAWAKRPDLAPYTQANARDWNWLAASHGILVDKNPTAGSIFQTPSGWYGHVGYVESVNPDGSINVSERNYSGCYGVLYSTIPASAVGNFNYIH